MIETSPSNAGDVGLVSGQGTEIPPALQPKKQNVRQRQYCNEFSKDFKNGPHQKILILEKTRNIEPQGQGVTHGGRSVHAACWLPPQLVLAALYRHTVVCFVEVHPTQGMEWKWKEMRATLLQALQGKPLILSDVFF